jgi:hypothetical protein
MMDWLQSQDYEPVAYGEPRKHQPVIAFLLAVGCGGVAVMAIGMIGIWLDNLGLLP